MFSLTLGYKCNHARVFYIFLPISLNSVAGDKPTHKNGLSEHKTHDKRSGERQRDALPRAANCHARFGWHSV